MENILFLRKEPKMGLMTLREKKEIKLKIKELNYLIDIAKKDSDFDFIERERRVIFDRVTECEYLLLTERNKKQYL